MTHFDGETNAEGEGSLTQVDHVVHNGTTPPPPPADQWRPGNGPYKVNPDCTGWMTITSEGAPAPLTLYFVIGDNGNTIHTVVSNPNINITSSATGFGRLDSLSRVHLDHFHEGSPPQSTKARLLPCSMSVPRPLEHYPRRPVAEIGANQEII
jgi:hypothetical protein